MIAAVAGRPAPAEPTDPLDAGLDNTRETIAALRRPAQLQAAEARMVALRERRAALREQLLVAIRAAQENNRTGGEQDEVREISAEIEKADSAIAAAREDLHEEPLPKRLRVIDGGKSAGVRPTPGAG